MPSEVTYRARILLVDDDDRSRRLVRTALEAASYSVMDAPDAASALTALAEQPVDLLLTDVVMPGTSGVQLAEQLRSLRPGLRVVFMSGFVTASSLPVDPNVAFIAKPFLPSELTAKVSALLGV